MIAGTVAGLTQAEEMSEIRVPVLPDFQRVEWVNHLAALSLDQALTEATCFEQEVRDFLADGIDRVHIRLEVGRDECARLENRVLEQYWSQLREYAQTHYVEERDVDDVLTMLAQRFASAENARRERELILDPFSTER
jgi:hypothetical protein